MARPLFATSENQAACHLAPVIHTELTLDTRGVLTHAADADRLLGPPLSTTCQ